MPVGAQTRPGFAPGLACVLTTSLWLEHRAASRISPRDDCLPLPPLSGRGARSRSRSGSSPSPTPRSAAARGQQAPPGRRLTRRRSRPARDRWTPAVSRPVRHACRTSFSSPPPPGPSLRRVRRQGGQFFWREGFGSHHRANAVEIYRQQAGTQPDIFTPGSARQREQRRQRTLKQRSNQRESRHRRWACSERRVVKLTEKSAAVDGGL